MPSPKPPLSLAPDAVDVDTLLLIVVGAHPRAEHADRPLAYALRAAFEKALARRAEPGSRTLTPLVVTDVWYLNDNSMRHRPTISIGAPGVNALTAYLADKVPSVYVIDDQLIVQLETDSTDTLAAAWGVDAATTAAAVNIFTERYLENFLDAICSDLSV